MARAGVNYHDIAKAAETIKQSGQEPTVDRVREHLGTGSKSTIAPLLKRWRSSEANALEPSGLPTELLEAVKSLHEIAQEQANTRIDEARKAFEDKNKNLNEELLNAQRVIEQLKEGKKLFEAKVAQLTTENQQQRAALEETRIALTKAESQRDESSRRVTELKDTVVELKQENRDIRSHFEHYQERTAEDRQIERDQFREAKLQLQNQTENLAAQLKHVKNETAELTDTNQRLESDLAQNKQSANELKQDLAKKADEVKRVTQELADALRQRQQKHEEITQLHTKVETLSKHKSDLEKEVAVLTQALDSATYELKSAQDKLTALSDENKIAIQEKAVLQGQLKQLQATL